MLVKGGGDHINSEMTQMPGYVLKLPHKLKAMKHFYVYQAISHP